MPFFTRWHFSDLNDLFREMEEMMEREFRELFRKVPKDLVRERTLPYGRRVKQWDPFVYGYSVTIGARAHSPLLMYFEKNQLFNRSSPQDIENFSSFSAPALIKA